MTTDSTVRSCLVLASVLGFALIAAAAHAQSHPTATNPTGTSAKRAKTVQPVAVQGPNQQTVKTDAEEPDMILLQEPFRSGAATPVSVTRSR